MGARGLLPFAAVLAATSWAPRSVSAGQGQEAVFNTVRAGLVRAVVDDGMVKEQIGEALVNLAEHVIFDQEIDLSDAMEKIRADKTNGTGYSTRSSKKKCKKGKKCGSMFELEELWGYGCFCNFGDAWKTSHGKPINAVDEVCQRLYNCYKCAIIDGAEEGSNECDPSTQKYKVPIIKSVNDKGTYGACSEVNSKNNCKLRTCTCDLNFATELLAYYFEGLVVDQEVAHANGFEMDKHCTKCVGKYCGGGNKRCCGEYPVRFPYNTQEGRRGCCWKKTYNTNKLQCCDDTFVKSITADCS